MRKGLSQPCGRHSKGAALQTLFLAFSACPRLKGEEEKGCNDISGMMYEEASRSTRSAKKLSNEATHTHNAGRPQPRVDNQFSSSKGGPAYLRIWRQCSPLPSPSSPPISHPQEICQLSQAHGHSKRYPPSCGGSGGQLLQLGGRKGCVTIATTQEKGRKNGVVGNFRI